MSEYGVDRNSGAEAGRTASAADRSTVATAAADGEPWFGQAEAGAVAEWGKAHAGLRAETELSGGAEPYREVELSGEAEPAAEADTGYSAYATDAADVPDPDEPEPEPIEDYADSDPQQWISGLITALERAEQGIGSGPRDALMARIKLAQAYSELGDMVQAAPLAVANVAQARHLFPSSEGMLRQLREFRDAACEAAGWTAAMMREPDEADEAAEAEPSELVARPGPVAEAVAQAWPAVEVADDEEMVLGVDPESAELAVAATAATLAQSAHSAQSAQTAESFETPELTETAEIAESAGAVIHEFVRRAPEADALPWAAELPSSPAGLPAELAIPAPPEPEYAEEIEPPAPAADLAAFEEIIRLRYELREAHRTIDRLKHVNRKLREALDFEGA